MGRLVAWLPALLKELNSGLNNSHLVTTLAEAHALEQARQFCLDLWPFIKELPENIACVRSSLPKDMEDGQRLLAELADEENIYRSLFIQQCLLAGIAEKDLIEPNINPIAENLKVLMSKLCRSDDYTDGFLAIITAELAATQFARTIVPFYEQYFQKHAAAFESQQTIDNGMAWLRLHAKPQTRNALLLNRALVALDQDKGKQIPNAAKIILQAILELWHCPAEASLTLKSVPTLKQTRAGA